MVTKIKVCRICGNTHLEPVLDLGKQMLTGVFPKRLDQDVTTGPLRLVKCVGDGDVCGLVQLEHSFDLSEMYGDNYGYRSGLNANMVSHLHAKVRRILDMQPLLADDLVVDIGANDSTTLQAYPKNLRLVGVDPTGVKFHQYYPSHIQLIPDFFSAKLLQQKIPDKKAKVITSFSMLYDLEQPMNFMRDIYEALADDGIWVFEQSYMPTMLEMNSYDTVCHEHLEYYGLHQIKWMTDRVGFKIVDVEFNDVNGGSFSVTVKKSHGQEKTLPAIQKILDAEIAAGLNTLAPYHAFADRVAISRTALLDFLTQARTEGKVVVGLGASTKGNVLLQYCGLTKEELPFIGEVNPDKYGSYTPGTFIPIISEDEVLAKQPDYLLILPWHFRKFFEHSSKLTNFRKLYPLPSIEVV